MAEGTEGDVTLQVKDKDGSRIFRRHAMRVTGNTTHTTIIGEMDGNRVYVRQRDGKIYVIFTDEDLYE